MRKDDNESTTTDANASSSSHNEKQNEFLYKCKICGGPAEHSNYGAMTCSPCKIFFRRNANREEAKIKCDLSGQCEINMTNRHLCSSCRLKKCFANGMQPELIRSSLSKKISLAKEKQAKELKSITATSNILATTGEENQLQRLPIVNLLQLNNSTLYSAQWTLLSNLIYSYDESTLLSTGQRIINENSVQRLTTSIDSTLATRFFEEIYETAHKYLRSNRDLFTLSDEDRTNFLRNAAESVTCIGAIFCWNQCQLHNCEPFVAIVKNIYGENSMNLIHRVLKYIDSDIVVFKLALGLFTFCNTISLFPSMSPPKPLNTFAIFRIQNTYAEVTWKYLLHKYDFDHSVQRFVNLIQCLMATIVTMYDAQNIQKHVEDIEIMVEKTELALVIDDIECIDETKSESSD